MEHIEYNFWYYMVCNLEILWPNKQIKQKILKFFNHSIIEKK